MDAEMLKKHLREILTLNSEIHALSMAQLTAHQRCLAITSTAKSVCVKSSGDNPQKDATYILWATLGEKISIRCAQLSAKQAYIMDAISQMPTGIYRTILIDRYINCKKWDDIAADMHYSVRHVTRLHGAALAEMVSVNVLLCPTADNI